MLVAIIVSLLWALAYPQPKCLTRYLFACLYADLAVFLAHWIWGDASVVYAAIYSIFTAAILLAAVALVGETIYRQRNVWRIAGIAIVFAVSLGHLAYSGIQTMHYYDWIGLTEATTLFWCGLVAGFTAPYVRMWDIQLTLGLFWMAQALWRWGFYMHLPAWLPLNWKVPGYLGIAAFSVIAWRLRRPLYEEMRPLRQAGSR